MWMLLFLVCRQYVELSFTCIKCPPRLPFGFVVSSQGLDHGTICVEDYNSIMQWSILLGGGRNGDTVVKEIKSTK